MSTQNLNLAQAHLAQAGSQRGLPVSQILMDDGVVAPRVMLGALAEASRLDKPVSHVLSAEALASRQDVLEAQARAYGAIALRRSESTPDPRLATALPGEFCLMHGILPWLRLGDTMVLATSRPEKFEQLLPQLPADIGPVMMAVTVEADIHEEIAFRYGEALARKAETWLPEEDSCRSLGHTSVLRRVMAFGAGLFCLGMLFWAPQLLFAAGLLLALASLVLSQLLKLAALGAAPRQKISRPPPIDLPDRPPTVSLLVPLFKEQDIARTLIARLSKLTYPKSLLDVVLILEAEDTTTRATLAAAKLPPWIRAICVPPGSVTTKPRALNYALGFTRGDIVGVYDAEDAPETDQIDRVVAHFETAAPDVGCLQGILDFYNPRANWLSRCFAIEYASWFRVLLPGLSRLGLVVPLGGTTLFLRRHVLEQVRGWDAHNVTEDADLGVRLARAGYRTELIETVTHEEANNRMLPWVKQRSRWLKGYGITWWVHARNPGSLWRDLGPKRFFGMHLLFLTTLFQFILAPVLWSFWLVLFGLPHPLDPYLTRDVVLSLTALFLTAEAVTLLVGIAAVTRTNHRGLIPWVPTLFAYFPLGSFAIYKALWETAFRPFYWDKTDHGHSAPDKDSGLHHAQTATINHPPKTRHLL